MDAKTTLLSGVEADQLAIGIQVNGQVGPNRTITMTLGAPMSMPLVELNGFMDKIMSVFDRQNNLGIIEALKIELEKTEKDLAANQLNRADYEAKCITDWEISNRKGEFRATESQRANLGNFDKTAKELRENRIPRIRKEITALERKLQGE